MKKSIKLFLAFMLLLNIIHFFFKSIDSSDDTVTQEIPNNVFVMNNHE
ncbi:hypothetical protein [Chondrinema litorale]|nr:hypothetical protein [Chondrinema litorale]UZR93014.1 hypothetical protein OQ292_14225 [Chondrinema litorale]